MSSLSGQGVRAPAGDSRSARWKIHQGATRNLYQATMNLRRVLRNGFARTSSKGDLDALNSRLRAAGVAAAQADHDRGWLRGWQSRPTTLLDALAWAGGYRGRAWDIVGPVGFPAGTPGNFDPAATEGWPRKR